MPNLETTLFVVCSVLTVSSGCVPHPLPASKPFDRSCQISEKGVGPIAIGMRREAHFVHDCHVKGKWVDDYLYAMLEDEWPKVECPVGQL